MQTSASFIEFVKNHTTLFSHPLRYMQILDAPPSLCIIFHGFVQSQAFYIFVRVKFLYMCFLLSAYIPVSLLALYAIIGLYFPHAISLFSYVVMNGFIYNLHRQ